ncbi:hypothetical protein PHISCL_03322 [Aspergillus sclerotialis]|uniref:Macro domain-like protein n=1 Tax=Aspergillus sclerotialis TaxID=2070753 RepID=A0A3A2ZSF8_9EURO|nr:hypothetical protein PHISCL_03322 [Aspergillus sclerotialis]
MSVLENIPSINLLCMDLKDITAFNKALADQWPCYQSNPKVKITTLNNSLRTVPSSTKFQLVVSPANSYGRLDGAFDDAISRAFCLPHHPYHTLTEVSQNVLYEKWRGFAPPGSCTLVPFPTELVGKNDWDCKWVAICPTMRIPTNVTWDREVVYECIWSLLCQVEGWNRDREVDRIDSILITPLATGCGRVSKERWAAQFVLALKHFVDALERPERWSQLDWREIDNDVVEVEKTWNGSM